jgi:two-component system CheB/CheR fusion protein
LKEKAIPRLFERRSPDQPIRIWVPGCATGEEAYSIAITCRDVMDGIKKEFQVQVFATDIDNEAIETARQGLYPASISVDMSQVVLDRHFTKEDSFRKVEQGKSVTW